MNNQRNAHLRILWLTENYFPSRGGMAESCDRIVHGLRRLGMSIDVAHFSHRVQSLKSENKLHGRDITCPPGDDPAHALNLLWNFIARDENGFTHLVAFGGTIPLIAGAVYSAWLGAPMVTLLRGNDFDAAIFSPKRADVLREALTQSSQVCVVSQDKARKIAALFPDIRPRWVPNGIDISEWEILPSHRRRAESWRREQVRQGCRVLGMFGHVKRKKGGLFFLETLLDSGLAERFHLLFVGELDESVTEFLQANERAIAHTVIPFLDRYELLPFYAACDLVVLASFYDGMPNVLLEAAALGIPLLAARAGGMADVLEEGRDSFLFYPGDAHECRAAIERAAVAQGGELRRLGETAQTMVKTNLTQEIEARRYLEIFLEGLPEREPIYTDALGRIQKS
jgi:glycosyltransferase involved in cell wall biosynthesis